MSDNDQQAISLEAVEAGLRQALAKSDAVLATSRPILRHLLANSEQHLFSDEVIAKVRGMLSHIARQLLFAQAKAANLDDPAQFADAGEAALVQQLFEDAAFLGHAHALTIEALVAEQLRARSGIDPVLSPLLQEMAAAPDAECAALSMRALASQARFQQQQRRMHLPLSELPGDLFHKALQFLRNLEDENGSLENAEAELRTAYDEGESRLGLIARLIMAMGRKAQRALAIDHAGLAIFSSALAMASDQDRNLAVLSFAENQSARLAISLCATGMKKSEVEEQFLYIHPDMVLPLGFDHLTARMATALLTAAQSDVKG